MERAFGRRMGGALVAAAILAAIGPGCGGEEAERPSRVRWQPASPQPESAAQADESALLRALGYLRGYRRAERPGGVMLHDAERAWPGQNLFCSGHGPEATLIDMGGRVLHTWRLDYRQAFPGAPPDALARPGTRYWRRVHLEPNGDLLAIYDYFGLVRIDLSSRLLWAQPGKFHHDLWVGDGRIYAISADAGELPAARGRRPVLEDFVVELSPDGRILRRVSVLEALRRSAYAWLPERLPAGEDVLHTNTLQILDGSQAAPTPEFAPGRALLSLRNIHTLALLDLESETLVWTARGDWRMQHEPTLLADGRLLLFDNLGRSKRSRVLELDPRDSRVLWSYGEAEGQTFYSEGMGAQQRLPNGNTLVVESFAGRAFEVTPAGDRVWSFENPARAGDDDELIAVLPDLVRLPPSHTARWFDAPTH
jgi:hypothetical protein